MGTPMAGGGRRRVAAKLHSAEEHALDIIAKEAEARLAARRAARAEARDIRMKELEKQQKEADQQSDRHFELLNDPGRTVRQTVTRTGSHGGSSHAGSRRSSEDSTDLDSRDSRDLRHQLTDLEDKFRKAMINNAQLDNEKSSLVYRVETLKDELEEIEENYIELQKDHKEKCRDYDFLKRDLQNEKEENEHFKVQLEQRDKLIEENGLVLVYADGENENELTLRKRAEGPPSNPNKLTLMSQEAAQLLEKAGEGSLDVRLKRLVDEKQELMDEIRRLTLDLEEERMKNTKIEKFATIGGGGIVGGGGGGTPQMNGPETKAVELQREVTKQLSELKFKLQKSEQENATLQSNVARFENQASRFKLAAEASEKVEDELKVEKRRLQRENREYQSRIEELETSNTHLQKRIDKLKSTRNAVANTNPL